MSVLSDVIGSALIAVSLVNAGFQLARLRSRGGSPVRQVLRSPAGFPARSALMTIALGAWLLTGGWAPLGVWFAIFAWELTVQATALVRRRGPRARSAGG